MWHWWSDKRIHMAVSLQMDILKTENDRRCTICSEATIDTGWRALLTEATLFAREFSNQLPELGEGQLPVVVLVQ